MGVGLDSAAEGFLRGFTVMEGARRNRAYEQRQNELWKRQDEDYATLKGMNEAASKAAQGGYDATGMRIDQGAPGDTPGATTPPLKDPRAPEQRILDGYAAAEQFALSKGRYDLAIDAHTKSEAEAAKYREKAYAQAWGQYQNTRDPNALLGYVKRFVRDGTDFDTVQIKPETVTNPDGTVTQAERLIVTGKGPNGEKFTSEPMTRQDFEEYALRYTDPQRAMAAAAARRQALEKARLDVIVAQAKEGPKEMTPGKRIVNRDGSDGGTVPGTVYEKIKGEDGTDRLFAITYGKGGETARVDVTNSVGTLGGFTKAEHQTYKDASTAINQHLDREMSQGVANPDVGVLQQKAYAVASDLIAANRGSAVSLEGGKVADLALKIARGQVKVEQLSIRDKSGKELGKADGFILDGRPVYTNPQQVRAFEAKMGQSDAAVAGAPGKGYPENAPRMAAARGRAQSPADFPRVSPQEQAGRDSDRVRVLEAELAAEQAKPNPNPENVSALQREIARLSPSMSQATPRAPAAPASLPPQSQASAVPSAPPPSADLTLSVGAKYDAAKSALKSAQDAVARYGMRQKRDDPAGFRAAEGRLRDARAAFKDAERAWQASVPAADRSAATGTRASLKSIPMTQ
jgi:hypothetical protein